MHLLVVCTAERGLCGAFNSSIVRLAREHANRLMAEGKTVKFLCVGRKGFDQLRRLYEKQIIEVIELRGVRTIGFAQASMVADKIIALFDEGEFDVATLFFSRFRSVIAQIPTAQQIIPPVFDTRRQGRRGASAVATNTSRRKSRSSTTCCRATSPCRCSARCWRTPRPSRARA